ncbi:hypothetical protein H0H87_012555, partial [Tephrocybe sp. NHM501043]
MTFETESEPSDGLTDALYFALAFNADHLSPDRSHSKRRRLSPLTAPVTFYDRHIDEKLQLKQVRNIPLELLVARSIYVSLESLRDRSITIPSDTSESFFPSDVSDYNKPIFDACSVAYTYQQTMASFAGTIASMLASDLQSDRDTPLLLWSPQIGKDDGPLTAYTDAFGLGLQLGVSDWAKETFAQLDLTTQMVFQRLREKYPVLAWWEIFFLSEDTEALMKAMGVDKSGPFPS